MGYIVYANGETANMVAPSWETNPRVYSGVEAAAFLFGGNPSDYAISTVQDTINHLAWYDAWGDHHGFELAETYSLDLTGLGYNGCSIANIACENSAYSAYVMDALNSTNYVYRVSDVPLPAALPLFASALGGLGAAGLRRKTAKKR
jgi:hypothetical protein